jgi:hypothetical protein
LSITQNTDMVLNNVMTRIYVTPKMI